MTRIEQLIRPELRRLKPYSSARDEFSGKAEVYLDANENPNGNYNRYPDPFQNELKKELSLYNGVPTENMFIGNGSDEIIDLLIRTFCQPGQDKIVTFVPTYGMYKVSAEINAVDAIELNLDENFQPKLPQDPCFWENPTNKLLFLCSPNNPTGNSIGENIVLECLNRFKGLVVLDEAYIQFALGESWSKRLVDFPNLVVLQTMSKAFGLAGARVGLAFANVEVVSWLNKLKPPYNVSELNQKAALEKLKNKVQVIDEIAKILEQRAILFEELGALELTQKLYPSDANFILGIFEDATELYAYLLERGIVVRRRKDVGENALRVSIGTEAENKKLIQTIKTFIREKSTVY